MQRESCNRLSAVHPSNQLGIASDASYEIDAFILAWVFDPENRAQDLVLQNAHIQSIRGIRGFHLEFGFEMVPLASQIHGKSPGLGDSVRSRGVNLEVFRQSLQETLGIQAVPIFYHPVVGKDPEFGGRKGNCKKPVEIIVLRALCGNVEFSSRTARGGRPMMPVSDVEGWNFFEGPSPLPMGRELSIRCDGLRRSPESQRALDGGFPGRSVHEGAANPDK